MQYSYFQYYNQIKLFINKYLNLLIFNKNSAVAMPNPFQYSTMISNLQFKNAQISVYNYQGQMVRNVKGITGNSFELKRENLPSGMYFLIIEENGIAKERIKLIIY